MAAAVTVLGALLSLALLRGASALAYTYPVKSVNLASAPAIEWYMSERAKYISGDVWAVEWSVAKDEAVAPFTPEGVDFGIFLDFSSLW